MSPRPITVTADDKSKVYGQSDPGADVLGHGGFPGERRFAVRIAARVPGQDVAATTSPPGRWRRFQLYLTFVQGELSITPKPITVTTTSRRSMAVRSALTYGGVRITT